MYVYILTSESAPLSAPGHLKVTYSWHLLCTTNEHTAYLNNKLYVDMFFFYVVGFMQFEK